MKEATCWTSMRIVGWAETTLGHFPNNSSQLATSWTVLHKIALRGVMPKAHQSALDDAHPLCEVLHVVCHRLPEPVHAHGVLKSALGQAGTPQLGPGRSSPAYSLKLPPYLLIPRQKTSLQTSLACESACKRSLAVIAVPLIHPLNSRPVWEKHTVLGIEKEDEARC